MGRGLFCTFTRDDKIDYIDSIKEIAMQVKSSKKVVYMMSALALTVVASLNLALPALAESEAGFFVIGGGSESGGVYSTGASSETGGVSQSGAESETGGVRESGAESESGGISQTGAESETGGIRQVGAETEADPTFGIRTYNWN